MYEVVERDLGRMMEDLEKLMPTQKIICAFFYLNSAKKTFEFKKKCDTNQSMDATITR